MPCMCRDSTLHFHGSAATHLPSLMQIEWAVRGICSMHYSLILYFDFNHKTHPHLSLAPAVAALAVHLRVCCAVCFLLYTHEGIVFVLLSLHVALYSMLICFIAAAGSIPRNRLTLPSQTTLPSRFVM